MNDPLRQAVTSQTAFLQAEGELRLKARSRPKAPPQGLLDPNYKSLGEDASAHVPASTREARRASGSPKTIQSP